ncbi:hypothetical protein WKI68_32240 [Streptomyces sp. MS1.HAVA.3]|uniref:Uncharacterized protein n=1 Tax=Streptomyces caledonius TaxID=3134107 RepID=A0ABU8U9X3_9ACTN
MNIPLWARWAVLGLAALQILGAYAALRRVRSQEGARRTEAKLDLVDALAGVVLLTGLAFGHFAVAACAAAVQLSTGAVKLIRWIRSRGKPAPPAPTAPDGQA